MKTKPNTEKPVVTQTITLTIKGQTIELSKEEALEIAAKLDEATGRKLPVPAPIVIEKPVHRDRIIGNPWQDMRPMWHDRQPEIDFYKITCEAKPSTEMRHVGSRGQTLLNG